MLPSSLVKLSHILVSAGGRWLGSRTARKLAGCYCQGLDLLRDELSAEVGWGVKCELDGASECSFPSLYSASVD